MDKLKFSIVVATYNSANVIGELLSTILSQTYENFELVLVDGASKDNTVEYVKNVIPQDKLKYVSEPDKGVYDAINKGLRLATGDYLIIMGSDDHFLSSRVLQEVARAIEKDGKSPDTIYYGGTYMECYHQVVNNVQTKWSWVRGTMCHQCIFYPKDVYKQYQYDLTYRINADYAYNLNLWDKVRFYHIDVIISFFSTGGVSGKANYDMPFRKILPKLIRERCGYVPYLYKEVRLIMGRIFKGRP